MKFYALGSTLLLDVALGVHYYLNKLSEVETVSTEGYLAGLKEVIYGLPYPCAIVSLEGKVLIANNKLEQLLGYSERELQRMVFTEFTHPDDIIDDWELFQELLAGKRDKYHLIKKWIGKTKNIIQGILTGSPLTFKNEIVAILASIQPITDDRKPAKTVIEKSKSDDDLLPVKGGILVTFLREMALLKSPFKIVAALLLLLGGLWFLYWAFMGGGVDLVIKSIMEVVRDNPPQTP